MHLLYVSSRFCIRSLVYLLQRLCDTCVFAYLLTCPRASLCTYVVTRFFNFWSGTHSKIKHDYNFTRTFTGESSHVTLKIASKTHAIRIIRIHFFTTHANIFWNYIWWRLWSSLQRFHLIRYFLLSCHLDCVSHRFQLHPSTYAHIVRAFFPRKREHKISVLVPNVSEYLSDTTSTFSTYKYSFRYGY